MSSRANYILQFLVSGKAILIGSSMNCGTYKITNTVNGKIYIGSSRNLESRWQVHLSSLRGRSHYNTHLQYSFDKYGEECFVFEVLLYCDKDNLVFYEQRAIDEYKTLDGIFGYNICLAQRSDIAGSNYDEWVRKQSKSRIGKYAGKNSPMWGKKHSEETKRKISEIRIKKELAKGKNNPNYGKKTSEETRKKISEAQSGKNNHMHSKKCSEHSERMKGKNNPNYGKKHTEETRKKISEAAKDRYRGKNHPRAKLVMADYIYYSSIIEAAKDLKVNRNTITRRIKTNKTGYRYV